MVKIGPFEIPYIMLIFSIILYFLVTIGFFNVDNYKYISLLLGYNDKDVTFAYSISTFFYFGGQYLCAYIWDRKGEIFTIGVVIFAFFI